jgi:hypothetical protein
MASSAAKLDVAGLGEPEKDEKQTACNSIDQSEERWLLTTAV